MNKENIPNHHEGVQTDTSSEVIFESLQKAENHFLIVKERLLNVNGWHELSGAATSSFTLTDNNGNAVTRLAKEGDHFMIKIPAPGNVSGEGYDWVQIKKISSEHKPDLELVSILVKPAKNPQNTDKEKAHFFDKDASSTFIVKS